MEDLGAANAQPGGPHGDGRWEEEGVGNGENVLVNNGFSFT